MTLLSWRHEYEVGVPLIDSEHKYIFRLINEFHDEYAGGHTLPEILPVLNRLVAYAEEHFQHEEALMGRFRYPRLEHQQKEHEKLYSSIYLLQEHLSRDAATVTAATLRFLKTWMIGHIVKEDMDIGDFLRHRAVLEEGAAAAPKAAEKLPANVEPATESVQSPPV